MGDKSVVVIFRVESPLLTNKTRRENARRLKLTWARHFTNVTYLILLYVNVEACHLDDDRMTKI